MTGAGPEVVAPVRGAPAPSESMARGGVLSLAGFVVAAAAGFLMTVVIGRGLGTAGAGSFFVVVGVLTVAGTVVRLGADTGLVWALPRAVALGRRAERPSVLVVALVPVVLLSLAGAVGLYLAADAVGALVDPATPERTGDLVRAVSPFLAVVGLALVLVGGLRGTGGVGTYTVLQNLGLPVSRLLLVLAAVAAGTGVLGALLMWGGPLVVVVVVAGLLLRARLRPDRALDGARSRRTVAREFWGFSIPRWATAVLEVVLVWSDVLVLAALTSPVEAGVYAAVSRFVTTGTMVEAASRVAIAPRVAQLLAVDDRRSAGELHSRATTWVVALSWPVYLVLGAGSLFALSLFGPGFDQGAQALTLLAAAMLVAMLTGNSQTMLLMSGRSGWQLANRCIAVALNLTLLLLLVPGMGLMGAAVAWSTTIVVDSVLVFLEVRFLVGLHTRVLPVLAAVLAALVCFGVPAVVARVLDPGGAGAFFLALATSCGLYALLGLLLVRRTGWAAVRQTFRPARPGTPGPAPTDPEDPRAR